MKYCTFGTVHTNQGSAFLLGRVFVWPTLRVLNTILEFRDNARRKQFILLGISHRLGNAKVEFPSDRLLPKSVVEIMNGREM